MDFRKVKRVSFSMFLAAIALVFVMNFIGAGSKLYMPMGFMVVAIIIAALILKYKYYRCPYCRNLFYFKEKTPDVCPYCDKKL